MHFLSHSNTTRDFPLSLILRSDFCTFRSPVITNLNRRASSAADVRSLGMFDRATWWLAGSVDICIIRAEFAQRYRMEKFAKCTRYSGLILYKCRRVEVAVCIQVGLHKQPLATACCCGQGAEDRNKLTEEKLEKELAWQEPKKMCFQD